MDVYIGNKIYDCVAYLCLFVPRDYQVYVAQDPEQEPYDPSKPAERDEIMNQAFGELQAVDMDAKLQLKKWVYFFICNVSNCIGVTLTLWGLGATHVFEQFGYNAMLFYCSFVFYLPFFVWARVLFFPGKEERERRKYIRDRRLWRKAVNETRRKKFYGIEDEGDEEASPKSTKSKKTNSGSMRNSMNGDSMQLNSSIQLKRQSSVVSPAGGASSKQNNGASSSAALVANESKRSSLKIDGGGGMGDSRKSKRISFSV